MGGSGDSTLISVDAVSGTVTRSITDRVDSLDESSPVVDCAAMDVQVTPRDDALVDRLPERFRRAGVSYPDGNWPSAADAGPPDPDSAAGSGKGRSDAPLVDHLDSLGIDHAVITGCEAVHRVSVQPERRYAAALTSAHNDWLVDRRLGSDGRLWGSIAVAPIAPDGAADEIRRLGDHPDMLQVVMGVGTQNPLGQERYWPIYEAAAEEGLPVAIHAGGGGYGVANPNTGAGYPGTALERRSVVPALFMGQVLSLVLEGVFVEFPDLRVVLLESGYSWLPSWLWRIDKVWKGTNDDYPWVDRPPSEYVRDHVWLASQPIAEADDPGHVERTLEMVHAEETLLFGSQFPSFDDGALEADLSALDPSIARAMLSGSAMDLYDLPTADSS